MYAGRKAFIVTRVGDTALIAGLFLLFTQLHTLEIQPLMAAASKEWAAGSGVAVAAAALLLGGAVGKSAQLPLQTWLPDAMAGPTPVSALIHAATMVTAGVYLIARTNVLYTLAPDVRFAVAIVGTVTLLYACFCALAQHDIKRVLAYSTMSQIGYMFLALGVAGWSAAVFHFMTHAFFKALLFLAAGVVIEALGGEHDIFRMGGLRRKLPTAFWAFVVGSASLAAMPFVTSGFYSKDLIIETSLGAVDGNAWLWVGALLGSLLTSIYAFRLVFIVFFGEQQTEVTQHARWRMLLPLWVLSALALAGGVVWLPEWMGNIRMLETFLDEALPATQTVASSFAYTGVSALLMSLIAVVGVAVATVWLVDRVALQRFAARPGPHAVQEYWLHGWGFDWLYEHVFVIPVKWFARVARNDLVDPAFTGLAWLNVQAWRALSASQTGLLRLYIGVAGIGLVAILAFVVLR